MGNSQLQVATMRKRAISDSNVDEQSSQERQLAIPHLDKPRNPVVAITYCDSGFAAIWPTFMKCYEKALGCSEQNGTCGPRLVDLGLENTKPGQSIQHCTRKHHEPALVLQETSHARAGSGAREVETVTPRSVPVLIANEMAQQLSRGNDVLRLDADAFLMSNPLHMLQEKFPDADIVSSPDCAHIHGEYCNWYQDRKFKRRHRGRDPFRRAGFMLNTGLVYIRSRPQTVAFAQDVARAIQSGRTTYEQIAFNEELHRRGCRWRFQNGVTPKGTFTLDFLHKHSIIGTCAGGLKVVVLTYMTFTRTMEWASKAVAFHPGGFTKDKLKKLPRISSLCENRTAA